MKGLTAAEVAGLAAVCRQRSFAPGEFILREGDSDPFVYILADGLAQLTKNTSFGEDQIPLAELSAGEVLGELKIVDPQPSSASVVAATQVTAVAIDIEAFLGSVALAAARAKVIGNIGKILASRLRARTSQGADAVERELEANRARAYAGRFIILMFAMIATYQLALSVLAVVAAAGAAEVANPVDCFCHLDGHPDRAVIAEHPVFTRVVWSDFALRRPRGVASVAVDNPTARDRAPPEAGGDRFGARDGDPPPV
jgi:CRP-like cAMP-binding protein